MRLAPPGRRAIVTALTQSEPSASSTNTLAGEQTIGPGATSEPSATPGTEVTSLGRYVVLRPLGSGGMGSVYVAYDPELDRRVAVKILRGETSPKRRRDLLMEAQAMAKLTHPNVVSVHDVGEHDESVYIAMELVDGVTLGAWLREERRSWREILEVFIDAGRGLEAAHERGLIHRDFKPDNVMVSDAGRPVVLDFGLARPTRDAAAPGIDDDSLSGAVLTEATVGRVAGTPAYMAPEQAMASKLTAAVDQFAFCVSLWEAVYGQRPFEGETYAETLANISEGKRRPAPRNRAPRWIKRVLLRGLRPDAAERWPSMGELLAALDRGRGRWRWQVGVAALVIAAVPVGVNVQRERERERETAERIALCTAEGDAILEVWNDRARDRLRVGLLATETNFAARSVETLTPWLDDFAETWRRGRTNICMHTTVWNDWSADDTERALWCLEDRQLQLEATVEQISLGDAKAARRAVRLASYLDPVETCLDPETLEKLPAPPPELRDAIRGVRAHLIESDRRRHGGDLKEALEQAKVARGLAQELDWPPLLAHTRFIEGRCLYESGRPADAEPLLIDAYFEAEAVGSLEVAFRAARSLVSVNSALHQYKQAKVWSRHANATARDKVDPGRLDEAEEHQLLATVYAGLGEQAARVAAAERAVELRESTLGENHPITASSHLSLARAYLDEHRFAEAYDLAQQGHTTWLHAVGPTHPRVAGSILVLAQAAVGSGQREGTVEIAERAVSMQRSIRGERTPWTAEALVVLGRAYKAAWRLEDAASAFHEAIETHAASGTDNPRFTALSQRDLCKVERQRARFNHAVSACRTAVRILRTLRKPGHAERFIQAELLARVLLESGKAEEAASVTEEALSERELSSRPDDPTLMIPLARLADAQLAAGQPAKAEHSYRRAAEIADATLDDDAPKRIWPLAGLANLELARGNTTRALELARRAARLGERPEAGPWIRARADFTLAKVLAAMRGSKEEARALATRARDGYAAMHFTGKVAEVDAWLAD